MEIVHDIFIVLGIDLLHVRCDIMLPLAKTFKVKNVKTLQISTTFTLMGIEFHAHGNRILSLHANTLSDSIRFLLSVSSLLACITRSVDRVDRCKHTSTHIMNSEDVTLFMCPPL